jgi:hypothetical protein
VADEGDAGAGADLGEEPLDHRRGVVDGVGNLGLDDLGAGAGADPLEFVGERLVLVIGDQDLVARFELRVVEHRAEGDGGVGEGGQVRRPAVEEGGQRRPHLVEHGLEVDLVEPHRVALEPLAELGLLTHGGPGHRAVRPVVQEGQGGVDGPFAAREREPPGGRLGEQGGGNGGGGHEGAQHRAFLSATEAAMVHTTRARVTLATGTHVTPA